MPRKGENIYKATPYNYPRIVDGFLIGRKSIGFMVNFFAEAYKLKPPGRVCRPEADSPART